MTTPELIWKLVERLLESKQQNEEKAKNPEKKTSD